MTDSRRGSQETSVAQRTTIPKVQKLLAHNYDAKGKVDLQQFVDMGSSVTDTLVSDASGAGLTITAGQAELVERNLAAYFYTNTDPLYASKSTGGASGSFLYEKNENPFLRAAKMLDPTGLLPGILSGKSASLTWLGTTESEERTYRERNW
jgi:hypothetical protein